MLTVFLFVGFGSVRYILPDYVGLGPKLHTCILFTAYVHYMFMNATSYIRFISQYQLNQLFNSNISSTSYFSIDIFRFNFSISFLALYLLSFVAQLVLFTILGISGGVPEVGPSRSGL